MEQVADPHLAIAVHAGGQAIAPVSGVLERDRIHRPLQHEGSDGCDIGPICAHVVPHRDRYNMVMYRLNGRGALWQDGDPNRNSLEMLKLVIGNKNYSSWSMRPWLALRANDIAFDEVFIPLYTDNKADKERILGFTRSGKVPALIDGDVTVWDSLAIIEYVAERFPEARLWPED